MRAWARPFQIKNMTHDLESALSFGLQPSSSRPPTNATLSGMCANICGSSMNSSSEEVRPHLHLCGSKYPLSTVKFPALLVVANERTNIQVGYPRQVAL